MIEVRLTRRFADWLNGLSDGVAAKRIRARLDRLGYGLLGDVKALGGGLMEARVDQGPGYRLYFVRRGGRLIVLLCGGDKSSQSRDIETARAMQAALED